ncbi:MAG TPA: chemotaxis protein CheX [Polyangiaceae bacterium]|nr:chemotaxis protein CheX [Polyangiaceae bacterium]
METSTESSTLLEGIVRDATRALFGGYGAPLELDASPAHETLERASFVAVIGFSSSTFNGSLLMALPNDVVARTLPAAGGDLMDWCGELANQLLGRLKNQLVEYRVSINMTLPVVISGGRFALPAKTRPVTRYFTFASAFGNLLVRLEAELSPDVELVRQVRIEGGRALEEGELLLF